MAREAAQEAWAGPASALHGTIEVALDGEGRVPTGVRQANGAGGVAAVVAKSAVGRSARAP